MDKKRHKLLHQRTIMMDDDDSSRRPKFSTITSGWVNRKNESNIGDLNLAHEFLGIRLKVSRESMKNIKLSTVKFRINNKTLYEPFLEGNDHRVYDIIQLYPKDYVFNPPAEMTVRLPSCVNQKTAGQVVCMFSNSFAVKNDIRFLQWGRIDSKLFIMNPLRTEAKIICKYSGFYTLILTQSPEVTSKVSPRQKLNVHVQDCPGIKIAYETGCLASDTKVTLKVVCLEDLYSSPSASPTFNDSRRRFPVQIRENANEDMIDVTGSPVVLVRPIRTRFSKPVKLSLPLLGKEFEGFLEKESNRLVVLGSREMEDEAIIWHHHYSTPEVETTTNGKKIATFLITSGGLFKLVRRFPNKHMRFIEQVSTRISRELCITTSPDVMVTPLLKGFITEIAEPGKQFVLRISLIDSSMPCNPDSCFVYEVCSQPLTVPLGKVRILVRGRFEPDRDAADHSEERTVLFIGKTTFVDFYLKLRLSDPTKLPETIGKVTIHSTADMQYYITLQKPTPIPKEFQCKPGGNARKSRDLVRQKKPFLRRHTVSSLSISKHKTSPESAVEDFDLKQRRQVSSSFVGAPRLAAIGDEMEEDEDEEEDDKEDDDDEEDAAISGQSTTSYSSFGGNSSSSHSTPVSNTKLSKQDYNYTDAKTNMKETLNDGKELERRGSSTYSESEQESTLSSSSASLPNSCGSQCSLRPANVEDEKYEDNSDWSSNNDVTRVEIDQRSRSSVSLKYEDDVEEKLLSNGEEKCKDEEKFEENQKREGIGRVSMELENGYKDEDKNIEEKTEVELRAKSNNNSNNNNNNLSDESTSETNEKENQSRKTSDSSASRDKDKTSYSTSFESSVSVENGTKEKHDKDEDKMAARRPSYSSLSSDSISIDSRMEVKDSRFGAR